MKLYGYNLNNKPVLFPVIGNKEFSQKSKGIFAMGQDSLGLAYIVYRNGRIEEYSDKSFLKRVIEDKTYLPFDFNPFDLSQEEWENYK